MSTRGGIFTASQSLSCLQGKFQWKMSFSTVSTSAFQRDFSRSLFRASGKETDMATGKIWENWLRMTSISCISSISPTWGLPVWWDERYFCLYTILLVKSKKGMVVNPITGGWTSVIFIYKILKSCFDKLNYDLNFFWFVWQHLQLLHVSVLDLEILLKKIIWWEIRTR